MSQAEMDHDDLPAEIDFTEADRGKFYQSNSTLNFYADPEKPVQTTQKMR